MFAQEFLCHLLRSLVTKILIHMDNVLIIHNRLPPAD
jgi:hypothetical protein